jgi:hypothetical protein
MASENMVFSQLQPALWNTFADSYALGADDKLLIVLIAI